MMKFKEMVIRTTPSGNKVKIPVYTFVGTDPKAPKAYLQSSVHGAELQGNAVMFHLMGAFKKSPPRGDVVLVPCANPVGMDRKVGEWTDGRFDPTTGENWNRAYWLPVIEKESDRQDPLQISLDRLPLDIGVSALKKKIIQAVSEKRKQSVRFSQKLALTLQSMAVEADVVLDLHNANASVPHLYAESSTLEDARYLGFPFVISIPPVFGGAMDEVIGAPWGMFKNWSQSSGLTPQGYTLELGNQERISFDHALGFAEGILQFLKHMKVVAGKPSEPSGCVVGELKDYHTIYAPSGGLYEIAHPMGRVIKKGKPFAHCLKFNQHGAELSTVTAKVDFLPLLHYSSSSINEGDELFKGFTRWKSL